MQSLKISRLRAANSPPHGVMQNESSRMLLVMSATSLLRIPPDIGLVPVGIFAQYKYVVVTRKGTSLDLQAYMAAAKLDKRPRNVGTAGAGSVAHLIAEKLFEEHDVRMIHVPYPGSASAIRDVLGEHIDMGVVPMPDAIAQLVNLEILAESGKGILVEGWMGLYAPPVTTQGESVRLGGSSNKHRRAREKISSASDLKACGFPVSNCVERMNAITCSCTQFSASSALSRKHRWFSDRPHRRSGAIARAGALRAYASISSSGSGVMKKRSGEGSPCRGCRPRVC